MGDQRDRASVVTSRPAPAGTAPGWTATTEASHPRRASPSASAHPWISDPRRCVEGITTRTRREVAEERISEQLHVTEDEFESPWQATGAEWAGDHARPGRWKGNPTRAWTRTQRKGMVELLAVR